MWTGALTLGVIIAGAGPASTRLPVARAAGLAPLATAIASESGLRFVRPPAEITLESGGKLHRRLRLTNGGDSDVVIQSLRSSAEGAGFALKSSSDQRALELRGGEELQIPVESGGQQRLVLVLDGSAWEPGEHPLDIQVDVDVGEPVVLSVLLNVVEPEEDKDRIVGEVPERIFSEGPQPKLVVDRFVHDFGDELGGKKLETDFILRNEGQGDLLLQSIRRSCTCGITEITFPEGRVPRERWREDVIGVLAPGEEATLGVSVDTLGLTAGLMSRKFWVYTNDPHNFPLTLKVSMALDDPMTLLPSSVRFDGVIRSKTPSEKVRVSSAVIGEFDIVGFQMPEPPIVDVESRRLRRVKDEVAHMVEVKVRPDAPPGIHKGTVRLLLDHEWARECRLTYAVEILPEVQFRPLGERRRKTSSTLDLGNIESLGEIVGGYSIENQNPAVPYVPRSASVTSEQGENLFEAEIVPLEEGMKYELRLRLVGVPKMRFLRGKVVVESDLGSLPLRELEFTGVYSGPR